MITKALPSCKFYHCLELISLRVMLTSAPGALVKQLKMVRKTKSALKAAPFQVLKSKIHNF